MAVASSSANLPRLPRSGLGLSNRSSSGATRRGACVRCAYAPRGGRVALAERAAQPNFYEVLGLSSQDVDLSSIKLAYRQMARKFHPDVCPREEMEECTQRFIVLQEAYETLSDSRRRAMYDLAISGALDSHGIAVSWATDFELSGLKRRSAVKEHENRESWAARIRRQQQQQ
ncbi:chaperone protein dnaJ 20, chloroplastic [Selaginella moellendorffii]|uniref:chaperone protein dnaJ 20, chloroplastic n=1 Tax=Selaginella moellendorffii TaxID=88036 RepID=UPI000D1CF478|nr:chaperone protein dnaJ 20, chloroplastic [Selaginella moellendorffii]|eukprot:XP_024538015.1 chaperone protein dnaJ 20, chloroplastic [Selaginella moellendorffii]